MKHLFFALFSLIFLAGCEKKKEAEPQDQAKASAKPVAPVSKQEPPKTSPKNTPKTSPKTTVKKPGTVLWEFETGGVVFSSPAIGSDGTVYVGSVDKKLYAIKTDSKGLAKSSWPMRGQNSQHTGRAP
jgi:hypothetical protein